MRLKPKRINGEDWYDIKWGLKVGLPSCTAVAAIAALFLGLYGVSEALAVLALALTCLIVFSGAAARRRAARRIVWEGRFDGFGRPMVLTPTAQHQADLQTIKHLWEVS